MLMTSIVAARENSQLYVTEHQRHAGVTFETKATFLKNSFFRMFIFYGDIEE